MEYAVFKHFHCNLRVLVIMNLFSSLKGSRSVRQDWLCIMLEVQCTIHCATEPYHVR